MPKDSLVEMESLLAIRQGGEDLGKLIFGTSRLENWIKYHPEVEVLRFGPKIQMIDASCKSRQIETKLDGFKDLPNVEDTTVENYLIDELEKLYRILMRGRKGRFVNV